MLQQKFKNLPAETGFTVDCVWHVSGSVGHWGHLHQRKNECHAKITVKVVNGEWKITQFEILDEKRL